MLSLEQEQSQKHLEVTISQNLATCTQPRHSCITYSLVFQSTKDVFTNRRSLELFRLWNYSRAFWSLIPRIVDSTSYISTARIENVRIVAT